MFNITENRKKNSHIFNTKKNSDNAELLPYTMY